MSSPKAVLFDLDDTLYDHIAASRRGLEAWRARFDALAAANPDALEREHAEALEAVHVRLLAGELTLEEARISRTRSIFARYGLSLDAPQAADAYDTYRAAYESHRTLVHGCVEVLDALVERGVRLAIVSNNRESEQHEKLAALDLARYFDAVVISEAVGITKPDPRIFDIALERLGVAADEAVMVGDSFGNDVVGAEAAGIRAVWLDRRGEASSVEPRTVLPGWSPADAAIRALLEAGGGTRKA